MSMELCPKCSSTQIEKGWILSAGKIAFQADNMSYPFTGGNVRSYICLECGYLESYVEKEYLDKVIAKNQK